jgi:hypothetical protein
MGKEVLALGLTLVVHVLGACALIGVLVKGEGGSLRDWWPHDEDDDGRGPGRDRPSGSEGPRGGDGLPLPDAVPSSVRLRDAERLAERYPRRERRPAHPAHVPEREPAQPARRV